MLAVEPSAPPLIRIRASGRLAADDYRDFEREFASELERRTPPVPLLLDMRGFRGWTPAGFLSDLRWDLRNRSTFSRIAVIGDARWHKWITVAGTVLFGARMKYFDAVGAASAEEWLDAS